MSQSFEILDISYGYRNQPILHDLSFQVTTGEFFIVIGPNGAGKTTLLKLLAGIGKPISGEIRILEEPIDRYRRKSLAQHIALVPQLPEADFPFKVREIVQMGRTPHLGVLGLTSERDVALAEQAMRFTGIDHLPDRHLTQLSGGERQRVFLARAICQEPDIILLDEPTAALDLAHQVRIMDFMERLKHERGMTVVMVSHDINLSALYADRMLLMAHGEIVAIGPPDEILKNDPIKTAYGCEVVVEEGPFGAIPRVTPVPGKYSTR